MPDGAQRPGGPRPVTGPAVPPYYVRSGGRLREQSSAKVPHRLAAAAGSLKAGHFAFLPINVVNGFILCGFSHFVKEKSAQTSQRKSQAKNAVLFQQTILRYFVHFGQHEKATRQSPAGSLCFIVLFPCNFRVLCVRFSLKYERTGAARPPPPSTRPAPCSHSARLKPSLGSCSSRFGFA